MSRPAKVTIDRDALRHNLGVIKDIAPKSKVLAILKANAYGHGMIPVAMAIPEADAFGVCCLEEALELRDAGITKPIILMEGFFSDDELPIISLQQLEIIVHHWSQIHALERVKVDRPLKVWLKLDSGMHRLGFPKEEFRNAWERLVKCPQVDNTPILMTHFASSDEMANPATMLQLACFTERIESLPGEMSLANSAAILSLPQTHGDWVRPGIMLYGISPFTDKIGLDFNLKPVMTLSSELIAIHHLQKGDPVGYGAIWRCPEAMPVGVVAMGYGDGYPRNTKNGAPVLVNGQIVPLAGRVSMDMLTVDLRTQPNAKVGDSVVLWGEGLPIEKIASAAGTISYELVCSIRKRVKPVFL